MLLECKIIKRVRLLSADGNKKKYKNDKRVVQCPVSPNRENLKIPILICMDLLRLTIR